MWRWNINGLGYSPNGYNGPYTTAITADGQIVADFITAGTLTASLIKAGTISSIDGLSHWNLETGDIKLTGEINATTGYISNFKINSDGISTGPTTINDHSHAGLFLANTGINFSSSISANGYSTVMVKPYGTINNVGIGPHLFGEQYLKIELGVLEEKVKSLVAERGKDGEESDFLKKYEEINTRFNKTTLKISELKKEKENKQLKKNKLLSYIAFLKIEPDTLEVWNKQAWMVLVEEAVVNRDSSITFKFYDESEITIA